MITPPNTSVSSPKFVYKIVPEAPPEPLPGQYPLSQLDQKDGFVHLSVGAQVPITASLYFKEAPQLWILKIRLSKQLNSLIDWTVPVCPHLYGNFGAEDIDSVRLFEQPQGKMWTSEGVMDEGWLE